MHPYLRTTLRANTVELGKMNWCSVLPVTRIKPVSKYEYISENYTGGE